MYIVAKWDHNIGSVYTSRFSEKLRDLSNGVIVHNWETKNFTNFGPIPWIITDSTRLKNEIIINDTKVMAVEIIMLTTVTLSAAIT